MNKYAGLLRPRVKPVDYIYKPVYRKDGKEDQQPRRSRSNEAARRVVRSKSVDSAPNDLRRRRSQSTPRPLPVPTQRCQTASNTIERLALSNAMLIDELSKIRGQAEDQEKRYGALLKRDQANRKLIDELSAERWQLKNEVRLLAARLGI